MSIFPSKAPFLRVEVEYKGTWDLIDPLNLEELFAKLLAKFILLTGRQYKAEKDPDKFVSPKKTLFSSKKIEKLQMHSI